MSVKVTDNHPKILLDTERKASVFLRLMAEDIKRDDKKTPMKDGYLRQGVLIQVLGRHATIMWNKVYASVQESGVIRGSRIVNYTTPGTGPHFAENAVKKAVSNTEVFARRAGLR